jgi:hypothetical protein
MKRNTQLKILAGALALAFVPATQAATTVNANASVTVAGTLNITKVADLNMGSIVAVGGATGDTQPTLVVPANTATAPSRTNNDGNIVIITPGTPASFEITGAAANTAITITTPVAPVLLSDPSKAPGTSQTFSLGTWTTYPTVSAAPFTNETNASGTLAFNVGATLSATDTNNTAGGAYDDGTYTGTFTVTVSY